MATVVKPYRLRLSYMGGFSACGPATPVAPFNESRLVGSSNDLTITKSANLNDWVQRIKEGRNASTDLTVTGSSVKRYVPSYYKWVHRCRACSGVPETSTKGSQWVYGDMTSSSGFPAANPTSLSATVAQNLAKERFMLNCLAKQRMFTGGVFLGELRKTLRMIRSPAKSLFSSIGGTIDSLRKRGKLLPKNRRKEFLANTYLEATYGWLPLISDIQNGAEALAEYTLKRRDHIPVRGYSGVVLDSYAETWEYQGLLDPLSMLARDLRTVKTNTVEVKYYGKLRSDPIDTLAMHARFFGFDPRSFVPTAWELIPYSFLVDYFTNIGNVINAWSFQTSQLIWCSRTTVKRCSSRFFTRLNKGYENTQIGNCKGYSVTISDGDLTLESFDIRRKADAYSDMLSPPSIRFRLPDMGMKWLNIAALAKGRFLKPFF